jgi:hypothetical protein
MAYENEERNGPQARIFGYTREAIDLDRRRVIARARDYEEPLGGERPSSRCGDIGHPQGDPDEFIHQTILPARR